MTHSVTAAHPPNQPPPRRSEAEPHWEAVKSCFSFDETPASSVTSISATPTPTRTPTPTPTPTPEPTVDYATDAADSTPEDLPNVNVPNPDLPGHRPHVVPHVHLGGHHGGHFHF
jgi:hypothetical protein